MATIEQEQEPPQPKKQKMSTTTTTSDDEETNPTTTTTTTTTEQEVGPTKKPKYKRKKIAIFFAYCGVGYQGMQKNPGAKTIEGDLEQAFYQAGGVPEHDKYQPRKYDFARSARTDKGVSAVGQVISGRFYIDPPGFINRLNDILNPQIRMFGFKRVTGSFNAKKFCDKRRYVYLIPVFALDPFAHRDRESVLASLGSGKELVKCLECSERGRKVYGVMGRRNFLVVSEPVIVSSNGNEVSSEDNMIIENGDNVVEESNEEVEGGDEDVKMGNEEVKGGDEDVKMGNDGVKGGDEGVKMGNEEVEEKSVFCYGEKEKERFNRILKYYEGTHNFHNFTTRMKAEDPAAKRFIISFNANTVVNVEGMDFVKCEVVGQSFMLHQIRKMIGLAVAIMRNLSPESLIQTAFQRDVNINVPMAPEVGLYLDECFFTSYNKKWKDTHEEVSLKDYAEEAEEFKMKHIYSHIASTEHKDGSVALWLHSLNYRNYPDLQFVDNGNSSGAGAGDGSKVVEAVVDAHSEVTEAVIDAHSEVIEDVVEARSEVIEDVVEARSEVIEAVVEARSEVIEAGSAAVNNGENASNVEAGNDADLVNS